MKMEVKDKSIRIEGKAKDCREVMNSILKGPTRSLTIAEFIELYKGVK